MTDNLQDIRPEDGKDLSETIYHHIFKSNPQPMWLYDPETFKILDVNEAAIQLYKYSADQFLELSINDIRPGPKFQTVKEAIEAIKVRNCIVKNDVNNQQNNTGLTNKIEIRDSIIYADGRRAELFFSSDITAIMAARKEGISSDEKLRNAQKIAGIGYWCRNLGEDISDWSGEMYEIFGRDKNMFVPNNENIISCFYPDDRYLLDEFTFLTLAEKGTHEFEHRIITSLGEIRWIYQRLQLKMDINGLPVEVMGVIQDITEKRKADEKFKAVFKHTSDAILIGDDAGNYLDFNEAAVAMFGYSRKELEAVNFRQLLNVRANKRYNVMWERFLKGEILNGTMKLHKKNGSVILADFNAKPHILPGVHLCVITDITERVQKTELLLQSERRFTALVQEGADLIGIMTADGVYKFISESSYPVLGIHPKEFIGKNAFDFIHTDDQKYLIQVLAGLSENKRIKTDPFRFIDSDGNWRWLTSIVTNLMDDPAIKGIIINARDITDTVTKTQALKLSNERYKLIMKAANEAIYDWDVEKDRVEWGIGFHDVFGYDLTVYNNHLVSDNIYIDDKERIMNELLEAVHDKNKEMMLSECRYHKANGDIVLIEYRIIFLRNADGVAIRAIGSLRDITNFKQNLLKIQDQNEKLREIAWQQSHVVRAPLTRLMALVDLIQNYEHSIEEKSQLLNLVLTSAHDFDQIVREITIKTKQI